MAKSNYDVSLRIAKAIGKNFPMKISQAAAGCAIFMFSCAISHIAENQSRRS